MSEEINPKEIMDFLKPRMGARFKTWLNICTHCGLCSDVCHYYLTSEKDPRMIPAYKVRFLKEILKKKGRIDRNFLQKVYEHKTLYNLLYKDQRIYNLFQKRILLNTFLKYDYIPYHL